MSLKHSSPYEEGCREEGTRVSQYEVQYKKVKNFFTRGERHGMTTFCLKETLTGSVTKLTGFSNGYERYRDLQHVGLGDAEWSGPINAAGF